MNLWVRDDFRGPQAAAKARRVAENRSKFVMEGYGVGHGKMHHFGGIGSQHYYIQDQDNLLINSPGGGVCHFMAA